MQVNFNKDLILDIVGTVLICYVSWVFLFRQQGIPYLDQFLAILGTVAVGIIAWRFLRKH